MGGFFCAKRVRRIPCPFRPSKKWRDQQKACRPRHFCLPFRIIRYKQSVNTLKHKNMNKITNPSTPSRLLRSLAFAYAFLLTAAIHMAAQPQDVEQVLTFSSAGDFLLRAPKHWDGTLYYSTNLKDWSVFEGGTIGSSNGRIYLCGKGNTVITGFETLETEEIFWRMNEGMNENLQCHNAPERPLLAT